MDEGETWTEKLSLSDADHVGWRVGEWEAELRNYRSRGHYESGFNFARDEQKSLYESGHKREQDVQRQHSLSKNGQRNRLLWLNLGHGALGFTLACGSGQVLAELIGRHSTSIDMQGFAPRAA